MVLPARFTSATGTGRRRLQSLSEDRLWLLGLAALAVATLLALAVYLYYGRSFGQFGFPLDDSWIHLQIARNVAAGQGWSFNPGEPTGASTAPLWVSMLVPLFWLPGDATVWVKILGALFFLANVILLADLVRRISGDSRSGLLAGLLAAWGVPYVWGALSGMELHLSLLLALLGLRAALVAQGQPRRSYLATVWVTLAMWARPEFLALLLPVWGYTWWRRRADNPSWQSRSELRFWAPQLLIVAAAVLAYVAFNSAVGGQALPATWHAKVADIQGNQPPGLLSGLATASNVLMLSIGVVVSSQNPLLVMTIALGWLSCWRVGFERRAGIALLAGAVVVSLVAASAAGLGGVGFQNYRRAAYVIACMDGMAAIGAVTVWDLLWSRAAGRSRGIVSHMWRVTPWLLLALVLLTQAAGVRRGAMTYANDVRSINEGDVAAARWIATSTPPDAVIAVNDIGAMAYFGRRSILDLIGLASPQTVDVLADTTPGSAERDRRLRELLLSQGADYVIIFPEWFLHLSKDPVLSEMTRFEVQRATSLAYDTIVVYKVVAH